MVYLEDIFTNEVLTDRTFIDEIYLGTPINLELVLIDNVNKVEPVTKLGDN